MKGFVQGVDRQQATLLPEYLDDWVDESNPVRAVDVFVDALELRDLGFDGVDPAATGRPGYHPSAMLKLYIFGYLNRVQSSRRLEREAGRNLEVMWLTGRLVPDHKTIADFRKDNGPAIKRVCAQFVALCRKMGLLAKASVAIDGSKFKAVNSRDNNFTKGKMERKRVFSGHGLEVLRSVGPGQQLVDVAVGMAVDDPGEDVGEVGERIDAVQLAGLDQRGDGGPMLGAAVGAGEQRILAVERDRADGALDDVVVDLDAAVVEEAGQALPSATGRSGSPRRAWSSG